MKKILFISSSSTHTKKFIDMLEDSFEIYLLTNDKNAFFDSKIKKIYLWEKNKIKNIWYTYRIAKQIKPDLISIQQLGQLAFFYTFLLHRQYKILLTAWGSDVMIFPYQSIFNKWMTKYSLNKATYISSIDSVGMISVVKCLSNFRKEVIPINFGINKFIQFESNYMNKENIIYSPRGHKDLYNIEMVVRSFAKFHPKNIDWKLYIAGGDDPINTPKYKELIKKLGIEKYVEFLGFIGPEEHANLLKKSKIVVSVPFSDGRPISLMEAIASNCFLIGSDILANRELISDGVNGIIVDHTKVFDINEFEKRMNISLLTQYNYEISRKLQYFVAKKEYIKTLKRFMNDADNR